MYFITTKRMLEVCFSAHPNIQYRTVFMRFRKVFREQVWGTGEKKNGMAQPDEAGAFFVLKPVHLSRILLSRIPLSGIPYSPSKSKGGVYSSLALLFSCMKPSVSPRRMAASTTLSYSYDVMRRFSSGNSWFWM